MSKGEAIDYRDHRTGQLDVIVYDSATCVPISMQEENVLLPCEALYVVVEVKSVLSGDELLKAYRSAGRVRQLRPFKSKFIAPRRDGDGADDGAHRCLYFLIAYSSNLADDCDWLQKEFTRAEKASVSERVSLDCIDRIVVLDRVMLRPGIAGGRWDSADPEMLFLDTYLHLINFVTREAGRRQPIDWQVYGPRSPKGWQKLKTE